MEYRKLGRTNLKVSAIGLGTGVLNPNKDSSITLEKARKTIELAVSNGINFIDVGKEYDEEFISKAMEKIRKKPYVITRSESKSAEEMEKDIKDSIKKLKVKPDVYEIMINSVEDLRNKIKEGVIETLKKAKFEGSIKFTGIFSHKIEVLKEAIKTNEFDVVMTLYNVVHRMAEEIFPLKEKYRFGFIAAAPFATGILVDPKYDENIHISGSKSMNAENALKFVLSSKFVDATVVGMKKSEHIVKNTEIVSKELKLTKKERIELIEKTEKFLGKEFCRMCRYCEGCGEVSMADVMKLLILGKNFGYLNFVKWQFSEICNKLEGENFDKYKKNCPYNLDIEKMIDELKNYMLK